MVLRIQVWCALVRMVALSIRTTAYRPDDRLTAVEPVDIEQSSSEEKPNPRGSALLQQE
jgi:hypothetical protein